MTYPDFEHALETVNLTEMFDYIINDLSEKQKEPLPKSLVESFLMFFMAGVKTNNSLMLKAFYVKTTNEESIHIINTVGKQIEEYSAYMKFMASLHPDDFDPSSN